jgi:hypothetical protein
MELKTLLNTTYPTKAAVNDLFPSRAEVDSIASALSDRLVGAKVSWRYWSPSILTRPHIGVCVAKEPFFLQRSFGDPKLAPPRSHRSVCNSVPYWYWSKPDSIFSRRPRTPASLAYHLDVVAALLHQYLVILKVVVECNILLQDPSSCIISRVGISLDVAVFLAASPDFRPSCRYEESPSQLPTP